MDWQPIETAPTDGRFVMLYVPNGQLETGPVTIGGYWKAEDRQENGRFKKGEWARADFRGLAGHGCRLLGLMVQPDPLDASPRPASDAKG